LIIKELKKLCLQLITILSMISSWYVICLLQTVDAELCSKKSELCHVEQDLERESRKFEKIVERNSCPQFPLPDLQNETATSVATVCRPYVVLFTSYHFAFCLCFLCLYVFAFFQCTNAVDLVAEMPLPAKILWK